jgi:hypothetical protein
LVNYSEILGRRKAWLTCKEYSFTALDQLVKALKCVYLIFVVANEFTILMQFSQRMVLMLDTIPDKADMFCDRPLPEPD